MRLRNRATSGADGKKAQEYVNEKVLRELDKQGFFKSLQKNEAKPR